MEKKFYLFQILLVLALANTGPCKSPSTHWSTVQPLLKKMTLAQKIGQMTQADIIQIIENNLVNGDLVQTYNLGSILIGGNAAPDGQGHVSSDWGNHTIFLNATMHNWQDLSDRINRPITVDTCKIYPLLGTDAVHGNQHVIGQPLFPHNIGLAATHDKDLLYQIGFHAQKSIKQSKWNFAFAPTVAVSHNFNWGRHYETWGSQYENISDYIQSYVTGLQQDDGNGNWGGVLASVKHFLGDGATYWGIDQGNATVYDVKNFLKVNWAGYKGGIQGCMGNVMASYSGVNQIPMSINSPLVTGVLKNGLYDGNKFDGFVISDYDAAGKVAGLTWPTTNFNMDKNDAVVSIINAGVDMMMLSGYDGDITVPIYQNWLQIAVNANDIAQWRLDDAVKRILGVKCAMGLITGLTGCEGPSKKDDTVTKTAIQTSLQAAKQSLVLLKNKNSLLPVNIENLKYIVLTGEKELAGTVFSDFDNIGAQCGGWTVAWQGYNGNDFWQGVNKNTSGAISILDAIKSRFTGEIIYNSYKDPKNTTEVAEVRQKLLKDIAKKDMNSTNTLIIGVIAESPYSEYEGDVNNPFCPENGGYAVGCLYSYGGNAYMPGAQRRNLVLEYTQASESVTFEVKRVDNSIPLVTVLMSGRPMSVDRAIDGSDAFIAAWLPATSGGEAIVASIFGEYLFKNGTDSSYWNTLPIDWPTGEVSLENYPVYDQGIIPNVSNPAFQQGFGLKTMDKSDSDDDFAGFLTIGVSILLLNQVW